MRGVENGSLLHAQGDKFRDIEKTAVVDFVPSYSPESQSIMLRLDNCVQLLAIFIHLLEHAFERVNRCRITSFETRGPLQALLALGRKRQFEIREADFALFKFQP